MTAKNFTQLKGATFMSAEFLPVSRRFSARFASILILLLLTLGLFSSTFAIAAEPLSHTFKIGDIECVSLSDGYFRGPATGLASEVPEEEIKAFMASNGASTEFVITPLNCLFLRLPGRNVLVDTGIGDAVPAPTAGKLQDAFREAGIDPADVDVVLISHLHEDHVGGAFLRDGTALFPNATFHVGEEELAYWLDRETDLAGTLMPPAMRTGVLRNARHFLLHATGRLRTFPAGGEAIPGVKTLLLSGHTPGQVGFIFQSGGETLLYTADTGGNSLVSLQRPDWRFRNDSDWQKAAETRKALWPQVAGGGWYVFAPHFPWPSIGRLADESGKVIFRPGL